MAPLPCQPIGMKEDTTPLIDAWQTQGFPWKAKVKATARKHQLQEKTIAQIATLHKDLFDVLQQALATFQPDPCQDRPEVCDYSCFCGISFATRRGLLAHQRRKHQIFSVERQFLQGAVCLHCGRFCWTTQRLQQHFTYLHAEKMPKNVVGLARREFLQTYGPQGEQTTALHMQRQN